MKKIMTFILLVILVAANAAFAAMVTFYNDGAVVDVEIRAVKGVADINLPAAIVEDSLRIKPVGSAILRNVEIIPADKGNGEKELELLQEQKDRLNDRLQALATREQIFTSAAKSQSGKAPRKTKTNPEPLQTIRQGTEFAIAQLETVYTARRKAEQEIKRIEGRIAQAKRKGTSSGMIARVTIDTPHGKVKVRYVLDAPRWIPRYNIYLTDEPTARIEMSAHVPDGFNNYLMYVSPSSLADETSLRTAHAVVNLSATLANYRLPVSEKRFASGMKTGFEFVLNNTEKAGLPAGNASLYRNGEYVARFRFEGVSSARSKRVLH